MYKDIMKILAVFVLLLAGCGGGESNEKEGSQVHDQYVIDYIQNMGRLRQNVESAITTLNTSIQSGDTVLMNTDYARLLSTIRESISGAQAAGPLYEDSELQQSLLKLLNFYDVTMSGPYVESLNLQKKPDDRYSDKDLLRSYTILDSISKIQQKYCKEFEDQLVKTGNKFRTIIRYE